MSVPTKLECLIWRDRLYRSLHAFFGERGFLHIETPLRLPTPALEDYIDAIPSGDHWLRTSPELHMKRLIAAGATHLYQIGPCFRLGEHGKRHRPEFTMLEWYQSPADYRDLLTFTQTMIRQVVKDTGQSLRRHGQSIDTTGMWDIITVDDAFRRHAGCSAFQALADDCFDDLLVEKVEPQLGLHTPTFLIDYPAELAALARRSPDNPHLAERWELYAGGLELANAFSELTDPHEQRQRFQDTADLRRRDGRHVYPLDEAFLAALERGMPPTAGCALGLDRLLMLLSDSDDIAQVLAFP